MGERREFGVRVRANAGQGEEQEEVFAFLSRPESYAGADGAAADVRRIDTHGAVVFLAGGDVYKVKRAVCYSFMDFSTREKRRAACDSEIAVNRANAPGVYLGVTPIVRMPEGLALGADIAPGGEVPDGADVVEWAVHMRRFDENATLDRLAERGALPDDVTARLAGMVARAHASAPVAADPAASVDALGRYIDRNAEGLATRPGLFSVEEVKAVRAASRAALDAQRPLLLSRAGAGFVRRCHGDMHLRNIALIDGAPVLFDAIEFDESIATVDILYDLAFLLMDLWDRGLEGVANGVLNRYLWARGEEADVAGLAALPLFLSIRAGVRAMVTAAALPHLEGDARAKAEREARGYLALAGAFIAPAPVRLAAIGGLSGTGKSTLAAMLAPRIGRPVGAVHLRSDIERKNLFGVAATEHLPSSAYTRDVTLRTYARLRRLAALALDAGQSVIADAVHAAPEEREAIRRVAEDAGARFDGLWLEAPQAVLEARVEARTGDASDAGADVVRAQSAYDTGAIDWRRLRTGGTPDEVAAAAAPLLGIGEGAA
ncbi:MAG: AAA family ATPase [Pseudochelatococcus sp.]|jgi:aminoglycoside phosphotransferase family enzyme/predicted kinase|uniref:bifunctional aminoglycoside phosphotransferase/ATP-binding protein n=1 Tax=Pseudochelatococcus sp. TaxID=2020869 RepID=UPI003D89DB62